MLVVPNKKALDEKEKNPLNYLYYKSILTFCIMYSPSSMGTRNDIRLIWSTLQANFLFAKCFLMERVN